MAAYVLIQTASNAGPIAPELQIVSGVAHAQDLHGPYDAIALTRAEHRSLEEILADIRQVPGVTRAVIAPLVKSPSTEAA